VSTTSDRKYDEYRKTCSIIFGKATASQLQYLSASIELQQMLLTSCDSIVANQLNWFEKYVEENNASNFFVQPFLRIYASMVDLCMSCISISYDPGTLNIQSYTKTLNTLNQHNLKIKKDEVELEGRPLSEA
jgi:hypothetical protein